VKINKNKYSLKKAFSLIELSIVILIIGILVAGVTQSSRLVSRMKQITVKSLTLNSPISSIKDLYSWHETAMDNSFNEAETSDSLAITNWYDLNPQTASGKINFNQTNVAAKPLYKTSAINGLSAIYFDGNDFMNTDINTASVLGSQSATFFFVFKPTNALQQGFLITQSYITCGNNIEIGHTTGNQSSGNFGIHSGCNRATVTGSSIVANNSPVIISMVLLSTPITNGNVSNVKIFRNGGNEMTLYADNGGYSSGLGGVYAIGNYNLYLGVRFDNRSSLNAYYSGWIGEVIIFSRALSAQDRKDVEKYLGKKWGIAVQ
jgi:prepilin-type N-terminal cleavage/methylation domain-containing protein